jgi:hypothetical protein
LSSHDQLGDWDGISGLHSYSRGRLRRGALAFRFVS